MENIIHKNFTLTSDIINYIIEQKNLKNPNYLEIGVWYGQTFNSVNTKNKDAVDPGQYCDADCVNYKMTSDCFFTSHITKKYDIIFIDGLHTAYQVSKDIYNSIENINDNGWLIIDDVYPHNEYEQERLNLRKNGAQTGDVWKAVYNVIDDLINLSNEIYFIKTVGRGNLILNINKTKGKNIIIDETIPTCNVDGWYEGNDAEWNKYNYKTDFENYLKKVNFQKNYHNKQILNWNNHVNAMDIRDQTYFNAPPNTFFSQYHQDSSLENCIFKGYKNGFYMDVGAHDGVLINNTLYFEQNHNWKGVNVEPLERVFNNLVTNRPNAININCAISDTDGVSEFYSNKGYTEMLSGLVSEYDERHFNRLNYENANVGGSTEIVKIITKRIETICDENNIKNINYLSIDVEGGEMKVIQSINFEKVFIDVIGFENNYPDIVYKPINYLKEKGYILLPLHDGDVFMIHKDSFFINNIIFVQ
jgi:FkbM family methyltransferase